MEPFEIMDACRKLQRDFESRQLLQQSHALSEMLIGQNSGTQTLRSIEYVLRLLLDRTPNIPADLKAKVDRLIQETRSAMHRDRG
ncbi:hypothetical protein HY256_06305 [Candidatus Sumerlaeota bacterium]|nr:hypothetical protein [Candidatus Sumerlaeota bacterium]